MRKKVLFVFLLFLLSITVKLFAQPLIKFDPSQNGMFIGKSMVLFTDPSNKFSIDDIKAGKASFLPCKTDVPNFGVTTATNWLRFRVLNNSQENKIVANLSHPFTDKVSFYVVHNNGAMDSTVMLESMPVRKRKYNNQNYLFDISISPGDSATCYMALNCSRQLLGPVSLGTEKSVMQSISLSDFISGLYFGIMIVMLLYNLFVFFSVKDKSYLHYVQYIFWVTLTQATLQGYGHRFLWPNSPWLTHNMVHFCGAFSGIATVVFVQSFLHTRKNLPRLHPILNIIIFSDVAAIILLLAGQKIISYHIIDANAALGCLFVLYIAYRLYRRDYKPARFFLLAWTMFLFSVVIYVLKDYGLIAYNAITFRILQIGSAAEAILLSFALADNINILKREKEASQAEALRIAKENERIIKDQNIMLEAKVNERTVALKNANSELNKTLVELKDAQTQLVESEKMASLGQLTAGIAHEINNPINFVTSNVRPLKRDISLIIDTMNQFEELVTSEIPKEEKQQKIKVLKDDMEYDYLMEEIDFLLKGISEGSERTAEIVKGLRIFSRVDEDDLKKVNLHEGINSSVVIVNSLLNDKIKVEKHYGELPLIECYPGKLNQVFLNIISNGIHAVHKHFNNGPGGIISITTQRDGDNNVQVKIKDNGIGMDEQTAKKIFEPFFTTKDVGEGTGLGLSIVYNIIKKHNGTIAVNSAPGEGAEFVITIPISQN